MRAGKRLIYSEMVRIFPLIFATVKSNLKSRNTKIWEGSCLPWRKKEKSNDKFFKALRDCNLEKLTLFFSVTLWGYIWESIWYSETFKNVIIRIYKSN